MEIEIPHQFLDYVENVIVRAGYVYPNLKIKLESDKLHIEGINDDEQKNKIKRDILYLLYREKLYVETLPIRKFLYSE